MSDKGRTTVMLTNSELERLRRYSDRTGMSQSKIVAYCLREYMDELSEFVVPQRPDTEQEESGKSGLLRGRI